MFNKAFSFGSLKPKINVIPEKFPVFRFPLKNPELNRKRIRFENRRDWPPTRRFGVCSKHFEEEFLKVGKRARLRGNYYQFLLYTLAMNPYPFSCAYTQNPKKASK